MGALKLLNELFKIGESRWQSVSETTLYEQPLNERMRIFLRLEHVFSHVKHALVSCSVWDSRIAIASLLDLLIIAERNDIKSECLKELDRHITKLNRLLSSPHIHTEKLDEILERLGHHIEKIQKLNGKIGQKLRDNEFLASIRQRMAIPGGTCGFDLPAYHHWLQRPAEERLNTLTEWFQEFQVISDAVLLMLELTRNGAKPQSEVAVGGFYQKAFDQQVLCQLVRVTLPTQTDLFPEISAGKHRIHIRFLCAKGYERPLQSHEDISFQLSCCT